MELKQLNVATHSKRTEWKQDDEEKKCRTKDRI